MLRRGPSGSVVRGAPRLFVAEDPSTKAVWWSSMIDDYKYQNKGKQKAERQSLPTTKEDMLQGTMMPSVYVFFGLACSVLDTESAVVKEGLIAVVN